MAQCKLLASVSTQTMGETVAIAGNQIFAAHRTYQLSNLTEKTLANIYEYGTDLKVIKSIPSDPKFQYSHAAAANNGFNRFYIAVNNLIQTELRVYDENLVLLKTRPLSNYAISTYSLNINANSDKYIILSYVSEVAPCKSIVHIIDQNELTDLATQLIDGYIRSSNLFCLINKEGSWLKPSEWKTVKKPFLVLTQGNAVYSNIDGFNYTAPALLKIFALVSNSDNTLTLHAVTEEALPRLGVALPQKYVTGWNCLIAVGSNFTHMNAEAPRTTKVLSQTFLPKNDANLMIYRFDGIKLEKVFAQHLEACFGDFAFHPDGETIFVGQGVETELLTNRTAMMIPRTFNLYTLRPKSKRAIFSLDTNSSLLNNGPCYMGGCLFLSAQFSEDGKRLIVGSSNSADRLRNIALYEITKV